MVLKDHECETKCASGCVGPHCYCDGYEMAKRSVPPSPATHAISILFKFGGGRVDQTVSVAKHCVRACYTGTTIVSVILISSGGV